jgi:hypothetical protein
VNIDVPTNANPGTDFVTASLVALNTLVSDPSYVLDYFIFLISRNATILGRAIANATPRYRRIPSTPRTGSMPRPQKAS